MVTFVGEFGAGRDFSMFVGANNLDGDLDPELAVANAFVDSVTNSPWR